MREFDQIIIPDGEFNADDVCCVAFSNIVLGVKKYTRAPKNFDFSNITDETLICDIGGKYDGEQWFDHHQNDSPVDETGEKMSAFGQIFRRFAPEFMPAETYNEVLNNFVIGIDRADNTADTNPFSFAISYMNKSWNTEAAFDEAVKMVSLALFGIIDAKIFDELSLVQDDVIIDDDTYPRLQKSNAGETKSLLQQVPKAKASIHHAGKNMWVVQTYGGYKFPDDFIGLGGEDLQKASGIATARFCSDIIFGFVCGNKYDAIKAAATVVSK